MGMGKSGHIGHKIAATFASTGTPSFLFTPVKPVWQLGMVTEKDIIAQQFQIQVKPVKFSPLSLSSSVNESF